MDCIFCKIANKEIPSNRIFEDDMIFAFRDINPVAPVHILVIPKEHIESAAQLNESHAEVLGHLWSKIPEIARKEGLSQFRVITNAGENAGQTVFHLHFHIIGGRMLDVKMG